MHFDFESVRVCYFDIDLGMSSLSNKWEQFLLFNAIYCAKYNNKHVRNQSLC